MASSPPKHTLEQQYADLIRQHSQLYYNGTPELSDADFDALLTKLHELNPDHPALRSVGTYPATYGKKISHIIPMGSQCKATSEAEFLKWATKMAFPSYLVQPKLDGISVEVQYDHGKVSHVVTRGDGVVGEDITKNATKMHGFVQFIPRFTGALRGEILIFHDIFTQKYQKQGEDINNCRNLASGIARRKSGHGAEDLSIVYYNVIGIKATTEQEKLTWMAAHHLPTVSTQTFPSSKEILTYRTHMAAERINLAYDIDGLIIKSNTVDRADEALPRPKKQIAFKFELDLAVTELLAVEWSHKGATFTPVGIVKPVPIAGTIVKRASLVNPNEIASLGLKIGSHVSISKRGEIIPKIEHVILSPDAATAIVVPTLCPQCESELTNTGVRLFCPNEFCANLEYERIVKYLVKIGVKFFSELILSQLFARQKIRYISDLYALKVRDLLALDRVGSKTAERAITNLHARTEIPLHVFIGAYSIEGMGSKMIKLVVDHGYATLARLLALLPAQVESLEHFGEINARKLVAGLSFLKTDLLKTAQCVTLTVPIQDPIPSKSAIGGKSFCFTGALTTLTRASAKAKVESLGGVFRGSVSRKLDYLVTNFPDSNTSKIRKAREVGVTLISENDFLALSE